MTSFAAARLRARSDLRGHWRLLAVLALVLGAAAGLLLTSAAGARRTASSYERLERETSAPDVVFAYDGCEAQGIDDDTACAAAADEDLPELAEVDGVEDVSLLDAYVGVFASKGGTVLQRECDTGQGELSVLARHALPADGGVLRPVVLEGRAADPSRPDEVTVNIAAAAMGISVGQTITADLGEFCPEGGIPARESIDLHVVGLVTDTVGIETESGVSFRALHATPALSDWAIERELERSPFAAVHLAEGRTADDVERSGAPVIVALDGADQRAAARRGVQPDVVVLLMITGLGLLGFGLVLAPLLVRIERGLLRDADDLRALGCTRADLATVGALHGAGLALVALPLAVLGALAASHLTPVGDARAFDPSPGAHVDVLVLVGGATIFLILVIALGAASAVVAGRRQGHLRRRPSIIGTAGRAGVPPSGLLGLRLAFEGTGGRRVGIAGRVAAQVVAVVVLVGAVTFSAGLAHLERTPRLLGWNWDAMGFGGDELAASLRRDPDVDHATAGTFWAANNELIRLGPDELSTWVMSFREGRSAIGPTIIRGRRPERAREIALHPDLLHRLDAHVGDDMRIVADDGSGSDGATSVSVEIVGAAVLPLDPDQLESGSAMTYPGLRDLLLTLGVPDATDLRPEIVLTDFAPGIDAAAKDQELRASGAIEEGLVIVDGRSEQSPLQGVRLDGVASVPKALGLMAAVLAALVLAFLVVDRVGDWRQELAMHRVLGFTTGQLRRSVAVGSVALASVVAAIAIPIGVAIGRIAWTFYATRLGVKPEAVVPVGWLALVAGGVTAVAALAALVPGQLASRRSPAELLRAG